LHLSIHSCTQKEKRRERECVCVCVRERENERESYVVTYYFTYRVAKTHGMP